MPTDVFFAEAMTDIVKAICAECPVKIECAQFAINAGASLFGVWGGLTRRERGTLRRAERRMGIQCWRSPGWRWSLIASSGPRLPPRFYGTCSHYANIVMVVGPPGVVEHLQNELGAIRFNSCVVVGAAMELAEAVRYARRQIEVVRREFAEHT
jgi:hypothetical protein